MRRVLALAVSDLSIEGRWAPHTSIPLGECSLASNKACLVELLRRDPAACKAVAAVVGKDLSEFENTPGITQRDILDAVNAAQGDAK